MLAEGTAIALPHSRLAIIRLSGWNFLKHCSANHRDQGFPTRRRKIGTKIFGCDECILACPYDLNAPPYSNTQFKFFGKRYLLQLDKIINWDSSIFEKHFVDSTIQRSGLERLKRNAQICLANTGGHQGTRKASSSLEGDSQPE